ncbi:protein BCL9 homolog [Musca vetustissima]|uniref:protein BCL9 homolog n=1 Tax=Musca vetustissima TaxID=27455 RepID=UPI002AB722B2|nr:protein BCL9 homolog [Musca vetustissima]
MMDINKRMQGLDESSVRQSSEMSNFTESQFSDTSNNGGLPQSTASNNNNSPCEEESVSFPKTESSPMVPTSGGDGDVDNLGNSNGSGHNITSPNSKNLNKTTNPNATLTKSGSDEKDIKEETTLSPPHTSPLAKNEDNDESQERSKSVGAAMTGNVNPNMDGAVGTTNMSPKSNPDVFNNSANMQNLPRGLNPYNNGNNKFNYPNQMGGGGGGGGGGVVGVGGVCGDNQGPMNPASNGGIGGGSGDYMQQQNHVFVFSTQLANKGAEAVVGGQFPTIIAYHCMQPSTKLFLEDFLKNPAKASKMQKQIPPNIMNLMQSGMMGNRPGGQPFWLNESGNNPSKMSHRPGALRNAGVNKSSPSWDPSSGLDNKLGPSTNPLDILGNTEGFDSAQLCGAGGGVGGMKDDDKSNIPSLQGVKVPDENLTPQQRQHREEQLAKLKKMNKFLFPENEGNDFQPPPMMNSGGGAVVPADGANNSTNPIDSINNAMNAAGKIATPGSGPNMGDDGPSSGAASTDSMNLVPGQNSKQGCASKLNPNLNPVKPNSTGPDSNPDMPPSFNMNNCTSLEGDGGGHSGVPPGMNMPNEEWSKFQNNVFPDGFKFRDNSNPMNNPSGLPGNQLPNQTPSLPRPLSTGLGGYGMQSRPNAGPSPTNRNNSGPPPPYHQTQRSASVPISTQSPTQPNLNNPNADIGLTSPHGGRVPFGMSSTPPHMDSSNTSTSVTNPSHSSATSFPGMNSGNVKNIYSSNMNSSQPFGGPQNPSALNNMSNSPGSLSLPHMSHPEMDPMNSGNKLKRGSPSKSKSPLINEMQGNMGMDSKYGNFGLNYNMCGPGGGNNMPHVGPQNMRQNMGQMPPQFCRRIDNIPLNPNCNRLNQNKPVGNFDPIASLAQMSQQLTGSAMGLGSLGSGGGGGVNSSSSGLMDVNSGDMMGAPGSGRSDHPLDHCNQMPNNNMGMPGMGGGGGGRPGPYGSDPMNSMDAMDQRMLNGKMCMPGHFNHNPLTGVGLRDSNMGGNDMMSANRAAMNRRMPNNFDNFNMSSNVHVRASAPNTIQYMPARSQNMNNMRMPPSMEFFQRYGNPHGNQMGGGVGNAPGGMPNNDMSNPNMMNLFGNCGQMPPNGRGGGPGVGGPGGPVGFEPNDLGGVEGNLMHNDAPYMNVP